MSSLERLPTLDERAGALAEELLDSRDGMRLSEEAMQKLLGALCRSYSARQESGESFAPFAPGGAVTGTDVMILCSALLKAADLQVFELGMWSSWTGR